LKENHDDTDISPKDIIIMRPKIVDLQA